MNFENGQPNADDNIPTDNSKSKPDGIDISDVVVKEVRIGRVSDFIQETAVMIQLNKQIVNENTKLILQGEELLLPDKLQKKFKRQINDLSGNPTRLELVEVSIDQHKQTLPVLEGRYITSFTLGLQSSEASIRLKRRGFNEITVSRTTSRAAKLSQYIFSGMNALLISAMVLVLIASFLSPLHVSLRIEIPLAISLILCMVCMYYRKARSYYIGKVSSCLSGLTRHEVHAIRDGKEIRMKARNLVSGDICLLSAGDPVTADMRVIECSANFKVNEESLTGRPESVLKKTVETTNLNPFEAENILFLGTRVWSGSCKALVFNCGDKSTIAKLSRQMKVSAKYVSAVQRDLKLFYKAITGVSLCLALFFVVVGMWLGTSSSSNWTLSQKFGSILGLVAGVMVASIPLLFPMVLVVGQRVTERRIQSGSSVQVRNLDVINSLSALSFLNLGVPLHADSLGKLRLMGVTIVPMLEEGKGQDAGASNSSSSREEVRGGSSSPSSSASSSDEKCLVSSESLARLSSLRSSYRSVLSMVVSHANQAPPVGGTELDALTDSELQTLLGSSRKSPRDDLSFSKLNSMQKLRVVVGSKQAVLGVSGFMGGHVEDALALRAAPLAISTTSEGVVGRIADVCCSQLSSLPDALLEARRGFNNLRRVFLFLLSSLLPRMMPLLISIAFDVPLALPLSMIVAGSLLVDLLPALALLWEPAEADLPLRKPRNEQRDRFVSERLVLLSLGYLGVIGVFAGYLAFTLTMSDYGFDPTKLGGLTAASFVTFSNSSTTEPGFPTTVGYPFDLTLAVLDNVHLCGRVGGSGKITSESVMSAVPISERCTGELFDLDTFNAYCYSTQPTEFYSNSVKSIVAVYVDQKDAAGVLFTRNQTAGGIPDCGTKNYDGVYLPFGFLTDSSQAIVDNAMSQYLCTLTDSTNADTGLPVCFTNEAVRYGQTSYFAAIGVFSLSTVIFVIRTELLSFFHIGIRNGNWFVLLSVVLAIGVILAFVYSPTANYLIASRPLHVSGLFLPALPFVVYATGLEEFRKMLIRRDTKIGRWLMKRTMW